MTPIRRIVLTTVVLAASAGCAGTSRVPYSALGTNTVSASPDRARADAAVTTTDASPAEVCRDGCCESGSPETPPTDEFVGGAEPEATESRGVPADTDPPRSLMPFGT